MNREYGTASEKSVISTRSRGAQAAL